MLRAKLHEQEIRGVIGVPGPGDRVVEGIATLDDTHDQCLYFVNRELTADLSESLAARTGCIVIANGPLNTPSLGGCLVLPVRDPRAAIANVLAFIEAEQRQPRLVHSGKIAATASISPLAVINGGVDIGDNVLIEPFCIVGPDARVGANSVLRSGVRIYPRVTIGSGCAIGPHTVVGYIGFGFVRNAAGKKIRIPHLGGVQIGAEVEIGALTTVVSGTIVPTLIEDNAKIDDHVHVGHNVRIKQNASITAGVIIGGHAVIETESWIGMNSSIRDGRRVGSYSLVGMDASVQQDLPHSAIARAPRPDIKKRDEDDDRHAIGFSGSRS